MRRILIVVLGVVAAGVFGGIRQSHSPVALRSVGVTFHFLPSDTPSEKRLRLGPQALVRLEDLYSGTCEISLSVQVKAKNIAKFEQQAWKEFRRTFFSESGEDHFISALIPISLNENQNYAEPLQSLWGEYKFQAKLPLVGTREESVSGWVNQTGMAFGLIFPDELSNGVVIDFTNPIYDGDDILCRAIAENGFSIALENSPLL